jgi:hypothetical protein
VAAIWLQMAIMVAVFAGVSMLAEAPLGITHAAAFVLLAMELAVMVAVATLFSSFTTPMLASFFASGIWLVGTLSRQLRDLGAESAAESVRVATAWLYRLLPDLASFDLSIEATHGLPLTASDVWLPLLYGAGYAAVVLVGAVVVFERRDFR